MSWILMSIEGENQDASGRGGTVGQRHGSVVLYNNEGNTSMRWQVVRDDSGIQVRSGCKGL